jgi:hypothetical protein|nr:MAG TPA: hypothetical protein [Caudoviricetes sp.]
MESNTTLVKVRFTYQDGYKFKKYIPEGEVREMSPDMAQSFINRGIATTDIDSEEPKETSSKPSKKAKKQ